METNQKKQGYFVVSLDFELFWGMFDKHTLETYGKNIAGERTAIPRLLNTFSKYDIHATWATVGMLMARNKEELFNLLPPSGLRPKYNEDKISSYNYLEDGEIGTNEQDDIYHFGSNLVGKIMETPNQEIGNHTFSHYYCIDGMNNGSEVFSADLKAFNRIATEYGLEASSVVFPRNQIEDTALRVCSENNISTYRGNENSFLYKSRKDSEQSIFIRGLRLLDHYINLTGYNTNPLPKSAKDIPLNVAASRFFRPWNKVLRIFEPLRMHRIKNAMTNAAKEGEIFHLWWHPHNFGINQEENFKNLEEILEHYKILKEMYDMKSASMEDISELIDNL